MKPTRFIANFDSAAAMLRAVSRYLRGEDFPGLGVMPRGGRVAPMINRIPRLARERLYAWGGWAEAVRASRMADIRAEQLARWVVEQYPRGPFPAVAIGSSNGAAVHLWTALGIPWLPQTFLIPVRRPRIDPDDPRAAMQAGLDEARALLRTNPEWQLHHMHDPNQDRLMVEHMTYFRVKRIRLGATFERFLEERLSPGGTIVVVDCALTWPTTKVDERHYFQHGALGGATREESFAGGPRVREYLTRYGSSRSRWDPPHPDAESPEAEWGFDPAWADDIEKFAALRGYRLRRLSFDHPEALSPLVADLYRSWYADQGMPHRDLLVESFILMEPWRALAGRLVPFWTVFNVEQSAEALLRYIDGEGPFDSIRMMLFSHGVESVGVAPIDRWRSILKRAAFQGGFVGVDEGEYPRDFATVLRYHDALADTVSGNTPPSEPLPLPRFEAFLERSADRYGVRWS